MNAVIAVLLGVATAALAVGAFRPGMAWLGWLMLTPLVAGAYLFSPLIVGLAGLSGGALYGFLSIREMNLPRSFLLVMTSANAIVWGMVWALAAWLWPNQVPAWGALVTPAAALVVSAVPRFAAPLGRPVLPGSLTRSCVHRIGGCRLCTSPSR